MYSGFLDFFKKSVQYDIYGSDYRTFIIAFGGMQFGKGMFTVFDKGDALDWERRMVKAFPEYKGRFRIFGCDWMGRCFAVPANNEEKIMMFDPGVLEVYEVPLNLRDFVNRAIPLNTNDCLASDTFISWYNAYGEELGRNRCVGYKVPLFLGGAEEAENFELQEMDVYWHMVTQAAMKLRGIPEEAEQDPDEETNEDTPSEEEFLEDESGCEEPMEDLTEEEIEQLEENAHFAQQAEEAEDFFTLQKKRAPYIKRNVDKYLEKFKKMHNNNSKASWNWCAFLFAGAWHLYRKLYKCFILMYVVAILIGAVLGGGVAAMIITETMDVQKYGIFVGLGAIVVCLAYAIIIGLFSDSWYRNKVDKLVAMGENAETEEREKALKKGGVNIPLLIVYLVICALATVPYFFMFI